MQIVLSTVRKRGRKVRATKGIPPCESKGAIFKLLLQKVQQKVSSPPMAGDSENVR